MINERKVETLSIESEEIHMKIKENIILEVAPKLTTTLCAMIEKVNSEEPMDYLFRGITKPSFGYIYGPAKSGKTIFGESLLLSIAANKNTFLGEELNVNNEKVMILSLEEFYRNRTQRNKKQIEYFMAETGLDTIHSNVIVADNLFPKHILTDEDWELLNNVIKSESPSVVLLDSLTRLTFNSIEDSTVASKIMKKLRAIAYENNIILIVIHHSVKMDNKPLSLANLAGSRVVGQEADFIIGINKLSNGKRYMKDISYRYAQEDCDNVLTFEINDNTVAVQCEYCNELELLSKVQTVENASCESLVYKFIKEFTGDDHSVIVQTKDLMKGLVSTRKMSKPTLNDSLKSLAKKNMISKLERGRFHLFIEK